MPQLLHPLSLSLLLPFFFISMAAQSYPSCPSYNCGAVNISYPFWRIDNQNTTQLCGYEGFGINCNQQHRPIITLGGDSYYVQNITQESKSIFLTDYDVFSAVASPNHCPRVRHGINLQTLPFHFSVRTVNLSFHYNCTEVPNFATRIPCLDYGTRKSCVNIVSSEPMFNDPHRNLTKEFDRALRGFELGWESLEDCDKCEESNGRCGHNSNTTEVMCFCSDGTTTTDDCKKANDGATILEQMDVDNHTGKLMVELSRSQDYEIGDGTTGVVVMAGALLEQAERLFERGIHPIRVAEGFEIASKIDVDHLEQIAHKFEFSAANIEPLVKTCMTTLSCKTDVSFHIALE